MVQYMGGGGGITRGIIRHFFYILKKCGSVVGPCVWVGDLPLLFPLYS